MPYRIDLADPAADAFDRLVELGALDVEAAAEPFADNRIAALMPDSVTPGQVRDALRTERIVVSPALGRDADSVWILSPRPIQTGRIRIVPAGNESQPGAVQLIDAPAFGTGLHPTTALCLETLDEAILNVRPETVLDVGTGTGVLALAALSLGVPRALGIDVDDQALQVAAENARINGVADRLLLARGGPGAIEGTWPLVMANILAAPLIEIAPALIRRVGRQGRLVLSGIPSSVASEVDRAYRGLGMHTVEVRAREAWVALVLRASW